MGMNLVRLYGCKSEEVEGRSTAFPGSRYRRITSEGNTRTGRRGKAKSGGRGSHWSCIPLAGRKKFPKKKRLTSGASEGVPERSDGVRRRLERHAK